MTLSPEAMEVSLPEDVPMIQSNPNDTHPEPLTTEPSTAEMPSGPPAVPSPGRKGKQKATVPTSKSSEASIPLGGRMTRSASLRQKENKKNLEVGQKDKGKEVPKTETSSRAGRVTPSNASSELHHLVSRTWRSNS